MNFCPNCGHPAAPADRFCSNCGHELAAAPAEPQAPHRAQRKLVTILFSDMTGSTQLGERLDPEALREVMSRWYDEARTAIERHGGTVEKFIGDAVMAVFGIPTVREDDALRAVRAAVDMAAALEPMNAQLESRFGLRINTRTGVNTGHVMAGDPATGSSFATGDAVNTAARLEQAAGAGEILIGEQTQWLVRDSADLEQAGGLELKGKAEPVPAWRLVRLVSRPRPVVRRGPADVIGRAFELTALHDAFAAAVDGRECRLVTVLGAAGIGKSRIAEELEEQLAERARTSTGRCLPYGTLTFWPLAEIVKQAARISEDERRESALHKIASLVGGDEDADVVADRIAAAVGLSDGSSAYPEETFWAVRRLVEALAREQPLVVVLDDIQWGQPTFLDLIDHLAGYTRDVPVLLLCLARPQLLEARAEWGSGRDNSSTVVLEPLAPDESRALVHSLVGDAELPAPAADRIVSASGGNPLFAEEMVRMLIDQGMLRRENGSWHIERDLEDVAMPPSINALLAARLDNLPAAERDTVEAAAVVGREFWAGAVAGMLPGREQAGVDADVESLIAKGIFEPRASAFPGEEAYFFCHILVRDVAYEGISKSDRTEMHERFAGWLERRAGARAVEHAEIVGYHLEQAHEFRMQLGRLDEPGSVLARRAAESLGVAGMRAYARGDLPATADLLGRAHGLLPAGDRDRLGIAPLLGQALADTGDLSGATKLLAAAAWEAGDAGNRPAHAHVSLIRAYARTFVDPSPGAMDELRRLAEEAIPLFGELGDHTGLARAWRALATVSLAACSWADTAAARRRELEHAGAAGDRAMELRALSGLAYALLFGPTPVAEALPAAEQILERVRGYPVAEGTVLGVLGGLQAMQGDFEAARERHRQARELLDDLGPALIAAEAALGAADAELLAGDLAAAESLLMPAYERLQAIGETAILSSVAASLALVAVRRGRHEDAERLAAVAEEAAAEDDVAALAVARSARAEALAARQAGSTEAESLARDAVGLADATDELNLQGQTLGSLATVLRQAGRTEEAAAAARAGAERFARKGNVAAAAASGRAGTADAG
jgi:class 3 adenylate cyclase/tetratricopeptide (TPR) repeat protein